MQPFELQMLGNVILMIAAVALSLPDFGDDADGGIGSGTTPPEDDPDTDSSGEGSEPEQMLDMGERLTGGDGDDTLDGTDGVRASEADTLEGGAGDDTLRLGPGDTGTGGEGADSFGLASDAADSSDDIFATINDFSVGTDTLVIEFDAATDPGELEVTQNADGSGSTIMLGGNAVAELSGTTDLSSDDIVLRGV